MSKSYNLSNTRVELDRLVCPCGACNCDVIHFHSKCHRDAGVLAVYNQKNGELTLRCGKCESLVTIILVAETLFKL